jgi:deoxyribodipyrimidine photolyase
MAAHVSLVWFRYDLRVADNPALEAAVTRSGGRRPFFGIAAMTRRVVNAMGTLNRRAMRLEKMSCTGQSENEKAGTT